jgi:hypothetical protein
LTQLLIERFSEQSWRVLTAQGLHVGNLKLINDLWKFKAIGYESSGDVIPGGGPLTERHNTTFSSLDVEEISRALLQP